MSEFKHCPHCNGNGRIVSVSGFKSDRYRVVCDSCGASTRECETEQEAVSAWDMRAGGWISVKERLPKNEQEVLVCCERSKCRFVCPAIYEDGTVLTQDSVWNWYDIDSCGTYSEENDDYFVPQGWWENRQFTPDDVYNNPVDCNVTHWMYLPEPPKGEQE